MTSGIQGPPGGPGRPSGPSGPGEAGPIERAGAPLAAEIERARAAQGAAPPAGIDRIAADLDAGKITGEEAIAQIAAGMGLQLGELEGAELRSLIADLFASDPYLAELAARLGR